MQFITINFKFIFTERKVYSSAASSQSTSSLSSKSLLCIRFGSTRSCSGSSPSLVRSSVHNSRQSVSIQHHCRDRRQNHFRFKEKSSWKKESQEDLSQQAQVPHCLKVPSTPSSAERELHELTHLPFVHGAKFVSEQRDFKVSTNISLRRSQV